MGEGQDQNEPSKGLASGENHYSPTHSERSSTIATSQHSPTLRVPQRAGLSSSYGRYQPYGEQALELNLKGGSMPYHPGLNFSPSSSSSHLTRPSHFGHGGQAVPLASGAGMPGTPDLFRPALPTAALSTCLAFAPSRGAEVNPYLMRPGHNNKQQDFRPSSSVNSAHSLAGSPLNNPLHTTAQHPATRSQHSEKISPSELVLSTAQRDKPSIEGFSRTRNGWSYRLVVVQHPIRARMCGFGSKDRRPLSPTLIVKLVITDEKTGQTVSPRLVNTSLFFLASDLCHPDDLMLSPRNVLVHQHTASAPTTVLQQQPQQLHTFGTSTPDLLASSNQATVIAGAGATVSFRSQESSSFEETTPSAPVLRGTMPPFSPRTFITEHYTRNLVGATVTSASVLRDETNDYAIFFVLQDLSVRVEGVYRIRVVFTNLAQNDGKTNEKVSHALAEAYTEPFSIYSPRRFPGMLKPTNLSKKLASQGIRIAVRGDERKRRRGSTERRNKVGNNDDE